MIKSTNTILAIDYGQKTVGLAIWKKKIGIVLGRNSLEKSLSILEKNKWHAFLINKLKEIIKQDKISIVILGLPKRMDGSNSKITQEVHEFAEYLKTHIKKPIVLIDERLSTQEALKKGARDLNKESARIILEQYITSAML